MNFRKPIQRKQGLKILAYGEDDSGKSVFALSFPKIAYIDTESKIGVYENNPKYNKNLIAIADTVNYYDVIDLIDKIIDSPSEFETFAIDSETNLYDDMQVAAMEVEEEKARQKNKNVDDAIVAQRGWGKVKLNNARLRNMKAQVSAVGITCISIAHKKDIIEEVNGKQVKIGERPELRDGSRHDYDIILRFYKQKDVSGTYRYYAEVEKDTTQFYKAGQKIENVSYENWKEYIESNKSYDTVDTSYNNAIDSNISGMKKMEDDNLPLKISEIDELTKSLIGQGVNRDVIKSVIASICIINGKETANYNKIKSIEMANKLFDELKKLDKIGE